MGYFAPDLIGSRAYFAPDAPPAAATPTVTGVSITPSSATVPEGSFRDFTITVNGTSGPSQEVTVTKSAGTISNLGGGVWRYFAPAATASVQIIPVTAKSVQDGAFSATATITVPAAIPHVAAPTFTTTIHTRARKRGRR